MTTNAERADVLLRALRSGIDGNVNVVAALVTDDVHGWTPAFVTTSRNELIAAITRRDDTFSEFDLRATPLDVGGDFASAEWSVGMTHSGPLRLGRSEPVPATGIRMTVYGITVAEFDGAQICSFRQYWDELAVLEQLGLLQRSEPAEER